MILKVDRVEFLKKIKIVNKAISENKIRPIISYVYLETIEDKLWFCGTNLELTISTEMECEILEGGKAVFQHNLVEEYLKEIKDDKGVKVKTTVSNDGPKKLQARRKIMSYLYDRQEQRKPKEAKEAFVARTKDIKHPLLEKIFNLYAPKYAQRAKEVGQGGGYTRIIKMGQRRGDAADMAIVELI